LSGITNTLHSLTFLTFENFERGYSYIFNLKAIP
jgi:hypothetical protein